MNPRNEQSTPNIVFIMADDMGYGDLGCYNSACKIPTPNMDRVASEGMRFIDAHSSSSVCTPSRYSVLTGRYCWRTRLKEGVAGGYSAPLIEKTRLTVASMLRQRGYHTACIGKWHVGLTFHGEQNRPTEEEDEVDFSKPITGGPNALGFDYAYYNAGCGTCAPPYGFIENDQFVDESFTFFAAGKGGPVGVGRSGQWEGMMGNSWKTRDADVIIARKACEYIEERARNDKPFFLYLTPNAPHEPCVEQFVPEFARGKSQAGPRGDLVWLFDRIVGEVLAALERTSQLDSTLIFITSDNGALPGDFVLDAEGNRIMTDREKREYLYNDHGHKSCGDWRGYKSHIWEGGHREPLIVRWPGKIRPGSVSSRFTCLSDLMATCADIATYDLPDTAAEDSISILPLLLAGDTAAGPARDTLIHHSSLGVFSIRKGKWKLIIDCRDSGGWPTPRGTHPVPGNPGQLYDLSADPHEDNNLWDQRKDIVDKLSRMLQEYKEAGRSVPLRTI